MTAAMVETALPARHYSGMRAYMPIARIPNMPGQPQPGPKPPAGS